MDQFSEILSGEEQLKNFASFLYDYDEKLRNLLDKTLKISFQHSVFDEPVVAVNYSWDKEQLPLYKLLESDRALNKTLLTFGHLCAEIESIVRDAREKQLKFLYLDADLCTLEANFQSSTPETANQTNERVLLKMSESIKFLCQVQFILQRSILLGNNLLHQCGAFLASEGVNLEFRFFDIFDYLSDLLLQILTFDEIILTSNFYRYWKIYKKTVAAIVQNSSSFDICSNAELSGLQNCLEDLDVLFSVGVFRHFLDSTFTLKEKMEPKALGHLTNQCNEYMKHKLTNFDKINGDLNDFNEPHLLVRINGFAVVFHDFCGQVDVKHVKHLLELNNKHQGIMLIGNVAWLPTPFLKKYASTLITAHEKLWAMDHKRLRQYFLQTRTQTLQRDCRTQCVQITIWSLHIQKILEIGTSNLKDEDIKNFEILLLLGLRYAGQISFLVKAVVNAHVSLQVPMTKHTLLAVCKYIEMLRMIQITFQRNVDATSKVMYYILLYFQHILLNILGESKKKISTASKLHDRNVDALAALKIAEKCINGPATKTRLLVTKLAINSTNATNRTLSTEQYENFETIMERYELLANFQDNIKKVCDTSFIYWHQSLLSAYLKQIVERKIDFNSFQHLINSTNECGKTLHVLGLKDLKLTEILKKSNYDTLRSEIISNLCAKIETFLRLEVHSNLQLDKMNPFEQSINDYRDLINLCPIELNGNYVVLKNHVENYLSAMFYNLTTISLHDWKTYEEMRHLAKIRLNLNPIEDYLPNQTLEQGVDILEIMRKIHIFVSQYVYNMNSQIFVEQQSSNKHLDTIGIRHVANSLRTHGTGVINTTVNFTYQFLRQKFYTFSQFLYDEQIKSRLMKEYRAYAERKQNENYPLYPYERADAFNKDIRKLGLSSDGQTYMDLFRKVITHIGNAMGYIRLVRSGSLHANYNASLYLPKFEKNLKFVELCKKLELHDVTISAAENFEAIISHLTKSFSESTDYFKILIDAFKPFFQNKNNMHLKTFFLIIPPLTLNYVQHMLNAKEKINKKERQEAVLFDDGFAIGLTCILKLLNQITDFNSLHWFPTILKRFDAERQKIKKMQADILVSSKSSGSKKSKAADAENNEKLQQTLALTERRINTHQAEYNLLFYNLSSSKIFFQ